MLKKRKMEGCFGKVGPDTWESHRGRECGGPKGGSSNTSSCLVVRAFERFFIDAAADFIELGAEARELALS